MADPIGYPRISLDTLFRVVVEQQIGDKVFFIRALSEVQTQERDRFQTLEMIYARKEAANPESEFYKTYVAELANASKDDLVEAIVAVARYDFDSEAKRTITPAIIPFPVNEDGSPITPEETQQVMERREAEYQRVSVARSKFVEDRAESLKAQMEEKPIEDLLKRAQARQVQSYAQTKALRAMINYTLYACTYTDKECKNRFFESPAKTEEVAPQFRAAIQNIYFNEIDRVDLTDVKYFLSITGSKGS